MDAKICEYTIISELKFKKSDFYLNFFLKLSITLTLLKGGIYLETFKYRNDLGR